MPTQTLDQTHLPCSICPLFFLADALNKCSSCGDLICATCPAFACSCVDKGAMQELRTELRPAAIELADLLATEKLMGTDTLTREHQARTILLSSIVESLRAEINRLDEEEHGEVYEDDETSESGFSVESQWT